MGSHENFTSTQAPAVNRNSEFGVSVSASGLNTYLIFNIDEKFYDSLESCNKNANFLPYS